jgi:hypothetical protein
MRGVLTHNDANFYERRCDRGARIYLRLKNKLNKSPQCADTKETIGTEKRTARRTNCGRRV